MARVSYVAAADAQGDAREVLTGLEERGGEVLNLHRALGNSPNALRNFLRLGSSLLMHGELPPVLRELAILRVAQRRAADYEWVHHLPLARRAGVTEGQIAELDDWQNSAHFDAATRVILRYVDAVLTELTVPDEVFEAVRAQLGEGQIVELTLVCGYWGMVAHLLLALEIDVEPSFVSLLPR